MSLDPLSNEHGKLPVETAARTVSAQVMIWLLLTLAISSMARPGGRITSLEVPSRYRIYLCSSPILCAFEVISLLIAIPVAYRTLQIRLIHAARFVLWKRWRPDSESDDEGDDGSSDDNNRHGDENAKERQDSEDTTELTVVELLAEHVSGRETTDVEERSAIKAARTDGGRIELAQRSNERRVTRPPVATRDSKIRERQKLDINSSRTAKIREDRLSAMPRRRTDIVIDDVAGDLGVATNKQAIHEAFDAKAIKHAQRIKNGAGSNRFDDGSDKRYREDAHDHRKKNRTSLSELHRSSWPRWVSFVIGTLPAFVRLISFSGTPWSKFWGLAFGVSYLVSEIVTVLCTFASFHSVPGALGYSKTSWKTKGYERIRGKMRELNLRHRVSDFLLLFICLVCHVVLMVWALISIWIHTARKNLTFRLRKDLYWMLYFTAELPTLFLSTAFAAGIWSLLINQLFSKSLLGPLERRVHHIIYGTVIAWAFRQLLSGMIAESHNAVCATTCEVIKEKIDFLNVCQSVSASVTTAATMTTTTTSTMTKPSTLLPSAAVDVRKEMNMFVLNFSVGEIIITFDFLCQMVRSECHRVCHEIHDASVSPNRNPGHVRMAWVHNTIGYAGFVYLTYKIVFLLCRRFRWLGRTLLVIPDESVSSSSSSRVRDKTRTRNRTRAETETKTKNKKSDKDGGERIYDGDDEDDNGDGDDETHRLHQKEPDVDWKGVLCFALWIVQAAIFVAWYSICYDSTGTVNPGWTEIFG